MSELPFDNSYRHGFARVSASTTPVRLADPATNARAILDELAILHDADVAVAVFPELSVTGYSIEDLVLQTALLNAADQALAALAEGSRDLLPLFFVGAPIRHRNRIYNCAVAIHRGDILGVIPKSHLPSYREFYETRWYASGAHEIDDIEVAGRIVPFGADLLFTATDLPGLVVHAEICEDMWVPVPPSSRAALAGATVLLNLSGSPITIGRAEDRAALVSAQSRRCNSAYVYAAGGLGESSNDVAWDGQTLITELGMTLARSERFPDGPQRSVSDIDLDRITQERFRQGTFDDNSAVDDAMFRSIEFEVSVPAKKIELRRDVDRFPFVPNDPARLAQDCYEAFNIQVAGLVQRLRSIGNPKPVLGVSGGLDSTHALLVIARAMDLCDRPRSDILCFTMPGFATSDHTKSNAIALAETIGASIETIDIRDASAELLRGIGHPFADGKPVYDVTFENVQAGMRTDFLFRLANQRGGIVVGTSDLSELSLGWATYGVGDHMSHYGVNAGVPKTLIQHLIRWVIATREGISDEAAAVLQSVLDTEISPELVPAGEDGEVQSTEGTIGPYALHDFALAEVLRHGSLPSKIVFLAEKAWSDADHGNWPPGFPEDERYAYNRETIVRWLRVFVQRFFGFAQFKRSAVPNAPKVSPIGSLSPRGDWRAPSDGNASVWLEDLDSVPSP